MEREMRKHIITKTFYTLTMATRWHVLLYIFGRVHQRDEKMFTTRTFLLLLTRILFALTLAQRPIANSFKSSSMARPAPECIVSLGCPERDFPRGGVFGIMNLVLSLGKRVLQRMWYPILWQGKRYGLLIKQCQNDGTNDKCFSVPFCASMVTTSAGEPLKVVL